MTSLQIVFTGLFLFNGVLSENTGTAEEDLPNEVSTGLSECLGGELSLNHLHEIDWHMKLGGRCFRAVSDDEAWSLFTKKDLDEAFANVSIQVCPSWTQSKECLRRHLSNKCDSSETQTVQESPEFNHNLVVTELICEPVDGYNMLQMFKDAAVDGGLGGCLGEPNHLDDFYDCVYVYTHMNVEESTYPPFKEFIPLIFECGDQAMKVCANGNMDQERALLRSWNKFQEAVLVAYGALWNHLTTPVSILDLLK